jgi:hypothetical protein
MSLAGNEELGMDVVWWFGSGIAAGTIRCVICRHRCHSHVDVSSYPRAKHPRRIYQHLSCGLQHPLYTSCHIYLPNLIVSAGGRADDRIIVVLTAH